MASMSTEYRPTLPATLGVSIPTNTRDRLAKLDKPHKFAVTETPNALSLEAEVLDTLRSALHGVANHFLGQYPLTTWTDILAGVRRPFSLLDLCRLFASRRTEARSAAKAVLVVLAASIGCYVGERGDEVAFRERDK
jgi:hypothetical protein